MKIYFIIILFVICNFFAGNIDGPANIRESVNGTLIFSLESNAEVKVIKQEKDWYKIKIPCHITNNDLENEEIKSGSIIYNENNNPIGKVLKKLKVLEISDEGKYTYCILYGYTHKNNIVNHKNNQQEIDDLLKNTTISYNYVSNTFTPSKYRSVQKNKKILKYKSISVLEIGELSIDYTFIFFFENDNLIGVVHSPKVRSNQFVKTYDTKRKMQFSLLKEIDGEEVKSILLELDKILTYG